MERKKSVKYELYRATKIIRFPIMWGCGGPGSGSDLLQIYLQFKNHMTSQFGCNNLG